VRGRNCYRVTDSSSVTSCSEEHGFTANDPSFRDGAQKPTSGSAFKQGNHHRSHTVLGRITWQHLVFISHRSNPPQLVLDAAPTYSFETLLNSPHWLFRMSIKNSRTVVDESGIHLVGPKSKTLMQRPVATFDDPFPDLTCENLIKAVYLRNCPVPVFSSTHDIVWWLHAALMQFGKGNIGLEDTVRITVIQTTSISGSQLVESNAVDCLEAMSEYEKPDSEMYFRALQFARASSQHLHCDVGGVFVFWTHDFTLSVSTDQCDGIT
jgi:hypothetical protein